MADQTKAARIADDIDDVLLARATLARLPRTRAALEAARDELRRLDAANADLAKRLRDEEERHAQLQARCFDGRPTHTSVFDEVGELRALAARDAKDAARYRFIRSPGCWFEHVCAPAYPNEPHLGNKLREGDDLDEAIDAALAPAAQSGPLTDIHGTVAEGA